MEDNREEAELVQEGQGQSEILQLVGQDSTANPVVIVSYIAEEATEDSSLQHSELGFWDDASRGGLGRLSENAKVSLDFVPRSKRVEELDNGVLPRYVECLAIRMARTRRRKQ